MKKEYTVKVHILGGKSGYGVFFYDISKDEEVLIAWFKTPKEAEDYIEQEENKRRALHLVAAESGKYDEDIPF